MRQRMVWAFNKLWLDILYPKETILHFASTKHTPAKETLNKSTRLGGGEEVEAASRDQMTDIFVRK